ncbi:MAG: Na+/H+ antiporter subunit E [Candidatus Saganbacteria bacterium]|nr:Na+/H+ antiporter subunit E [Candidatus Saganbacteria bacterium]
MQRAIIFIVSYIMYLLLTFLPDRQELIIGLFVAFFVTFIFSNIIQFRPKKLFEIRRYFYSIYYMFVFLYYFIKANVDVAYRVLHPGMPINPGIVKIKTDLKSDLAITALANSVREDPKGGF